jgi:alpha-glucosidase
MLVAVISLCCLLCIDSATTSIKQTDEVDWWQKSVFYQIYPRSFKDSDGDGIGDLRGIIEKLPHLHDLGVGATWLSPIMKSPMVDFGYDVEDFFEIDPLFGTMADFDELMVKAKELGIILQIL